MEPKRISLYCSFIAIKIKEIQLFACCSQINASCSKTRKKRFLKAFMTTNRTDGEVCYAKLRKFRRLSKTSQHHIQCNEIKSEDK
ncbi:CLUMA_CG007054, isoform A [Clunio marinus]|uniref:CLUMA_CG007054, isoform A n=1 Tax=Clunio marinus TaxID=568069 RepID=A0A1J1I566_9DIPT|nr:CLUMA_CG007054, isoform A [Clunio marinus]